MKFRYLGDKKEMKVFGYDFSNSATPNVKDEKIINRLLGNPYFEAIKNTSLTRPSVETLLSDIEKASTETALNLIAENEDRSQILEAVDNKKKELAEKQ